MLFSAALCSTLPPEFDTLIMRLRLAKRTERLPEDHFHPYQIEFFILNCNALASVPWSPGTSAGREPNPEAGFWPGCCWSSAITMERGGGGALTSRPHPRLCAAPDPPLLERLSQLGQPAESTTEHGYKTLWSDPRKNTKPNQKRHPGTQKAFRRGISAAANSTPAAASSSYRRAACVKVRAGSRSHTGSTAAEIKHAGVKPCFSGQIIHKSTH